MRTILNKQHFKCPVCDSDDIEIEINISPKDWDSYNLEIDIMCLDCAKNLKGAQTYWNLSDFNKILENKTKK